MNTLKIFCFSILYSTCIIGCQSEPTYVKLNPGFGKELNQKVHGKVKSLTYHTYEPELDNGKVVKGKLSNDLNVIYGTGIRADFDSKGKITNYHYLNRLDTTTKSMNKWEYVKANEIWFMRYGTYNNLEMMRMSKRYYDSNQNLIRIIYLEPIANWEKPLLENYIPKSSLDKDIIGDSLKITGKEYHFYNKDNIETNGRNYDFIYDDLGSTIEIKIDSNSYENTFSYENGKLESFNDKLYEYSDEGIKVTNTEGKDYRQFYSTGILKRIWFSNISYKKFNEDGYPTDWDGVSGAHRATYSDIDEKGNWTKSIFYREGKPAMITERMITYYE